MLIIDELGCCQCVEQKDLLAKDRVFERADVIGGWYVKRTAFI